MKDEPTTQETTQDQEARRRPWFLLPWMVLVFLILFCCGQVALLTNLPAEGGDTRSQIQADYAPWAFMPMAPLDPRLLLEMAQDLGLDGLPPIATAVGCLLPGSCDTPTPTGTLATPTTAPGTPGPGTVTTTPTASPVTPTRTPTNPPPTYTPTVTNTPTNTPTPTPLVYPVKQASPSRIPPGAATVDFTIRVINYGSPAPALLTRLTDTLPPQMTYRAGSCVPACTTGSGQTVEWLGSWSIPQGSFITFRFTADVAGTAGGEELVNWIEAVGSNFDLAINNRRVTVLTPTPTATPTSVPVAGDDAYAGTEDTILNVGALAGLLANDTDANGDPLSVQPAPVSGPSRGAVVLNADGSFTYTPNADYYGLDSFVYRVCDATALCDTATATITLAGTPDDPIALDDAYATNEDGTLLAASPGVRLNDRDPDDLTPPLYDTLTVSLVTPPGHQDPANPFYLNADGSFGFWPTADWHGTEAFTYRACDPTARCDNATVQLTVNSVNDAPSGADHAVTTPEDVAYVFLLTDFPFSDPNDAPANSLSAVVISALPASGTLALSGVPVGAGQAIPAASITAGSLTYLSPLNANGSPYTTFTFRVRDDGGTALGGVNTDPTPNTLTINVTPVNDAPVAVNDSWTLNLAYIVGQGGTMVVPPPPPAPAGVLSNDTDVDDPVSTLSAAYLVGSGPVQHVGGAFALQPDGSFTYQPDPLFHGLDGFQYAACDPAPLCSGALATVTLLVDDPPVSQPDLFTLTEDPLVALAGNVLADNGLGPDTDPNGDALMVQLVSAPVNAAAFALNADGSFTYTPALNYNGPDAFQYRAFDGWLYGNTVGVGLTITPVNDAPVANPDSVRTPADTPLTIPVLANDTDVEGGPLRVAAMVTWPTHGGVVNNGTDVTYTPGPGYVGNDFFEYQVCDPGADLNPGNGDDLCDTAWASVVVNGPPSGVDDAYSLAEDTTRNVAAPGVLGNDTDPNGDALTAVLVSGPSHAATFSLNANGSFSYRPAANYNGPDSFTYNVCDPDVCDPTPPTTVSLTINPVQDPPIAVDDGSVGSPLAVIEDTPLNILVLANDSDPDGDPLSILSAGNPPHGTAIIQDNGTPADPTDDYVRYTPDLNYAGDDSFQYTISALGGTDTATVYVRVSPVNDPPTALDNWYRTSVDTLRTVAAPGVLGNDTDPEGDTPITAGLISPPGNGTLIGTVACPSGLCADGSFQYLPNLAFHGEDTFVYEACDPSLACDSATVTISVNGPPVAVDDPTPPAVWSLPEDGSLLILAPDVMANDTDPDLDVLELDSVGNPPNGTAVLDDNGTPGVPGDDTITYTPDPDYFGPDTFTYRVCDPLGGCDQATITVSVLAVNDAPLARDDPQAPTVYRANVGASPQLVVAAPGVLGNDTDVDGDPLQASLVAGAGLGIVGLNPDGSFVYTPNPGARGVDTFVYEACDPSLACDSATVTVVVNGVPQAIDDPGYSTDEDVPLAVGAAAGVLANDLEPDGESLTASLVSGPAGLTLNADGSFTYSPPLNFNSPPPVRFDYQACDNPWGACDTATATIVVNPVNDPPVANGDSAWTNLDQPVAIDVLGNDTDVDGDTPTIDGLVTPPANGSALVNDNGTPGDPTDDYYDYTPAPGYYSDPAPDTFTYRITDGNGAFATAFVSVTVNGPPAAGPAESYSTDEDTVLTVAAPGLLANDSDPNGDPLEAHLLIGPAQAQAFALNPDGSFSYTPAGDFYGPDGFSYEVCDVPGGLCTAAVAVDLTVVPVNDPPVARDDGPYLTDEDTPLDVDALSGVLGNDNDPVEGDSVTAVAASGTSSQGGSFTVAADGSFSYAPAANYFGLDTFTYQAFDGTDPSAPATVTINVASVNDAPSAADDSATTNQITPVTVNVVANDSDVDGVVVASSASVVSGPASGSLVNNGDGTFTYTPAAGQYWSASFTYTVDDNLGVPSNVATATVNIRPAVLQIVKDADPETAALGDPITFYIYVWNNGPGTAYGVDLSDTLGSCFAYVGAPPDGPLGDIAEGGAAVRVAYARVVADTACDNTNTAQLTAANASPVSDSATVTFLPMGGGGSPSGMLALSAMDPLPPGTGADPGVPLGDPLPPAEPPAEPPTEPAPTPPPQPTPTSLVVTQGSLLADSGNPLAWVALILTGIWLGRSLVFRVRLPHSLTHGGTRYHEPATRPHRR